MDGSPGIRCDEMGGPDQGHEIPNQTLPYRHVVSLRDKDIDERCPLCLEAFS